MSSRFYFYRDDAVSIIVEKVNFHAFLWFEIVQIRMTYDHLLIDVILDNTAFIHIVRLRQEVSVVDSAEGCQHANIGKIYLEIVPVIISAQWGSREFYFVNF